MIATIEVIGQDQLLTSQRDGYVRASYPAGAQTILSVQPGGQVELRPAGTDGAYEQAIVLANGNLSYQPIDGKTTWAVLGASLKPL